MARDNHPLVEASSPESRHVMVDSAKSYAMVRVPNRKASPEELPVFAGIDAGSIPGAAAMAMYKTLDDVASVVEASIPWRNYILRPRQNFKELQEMTTEQQIDALVWNTVMTGLWAMPIPKTLPFKNIWAEPARRLGRKAAFGFDKAVRKLRPLPPPGKVKSLEGFRQKGYWEQLPKTLESKYKVKLATEQKAIADYLGGDKNALTNKFLSATKPPSKPFEDLLTAGSTVAKKGTSLPPIVLKPDVIRRLGPRALRHDDLIRQYRKRLGSVLELGNLEGKAAKAELYKLSEGTFHKYIEAVYGKEAASVLKGKRGRTITPSYATTQEVADVLQFLHSNRGPAAIKKAADFSRWGYLGRVGYTMGLYEEFLGMSSKVHKPAVKGMEARQVYRQMAYAEVEKLMLKNKFLKQKGNRLVQTEAGSAKVQDLVAKYLLRVRDVERKLAARGKKLSPVELAEIRSKLRATIKDNTLEGRAAKYMLKVIGDFNDFMYADYAKWKLHQTLLRKEINPTGLSRVDDLVRENEPLIDAIFDAEAGLSIVEKAAAFSRLLKNVRNTLNAEGKFWYDVAGSDRARRKFWARLHTGLTPGKGFQAYKYGLTEISASGKGAVMNTLKLGSDAKAEFYRKIQFVSGHKEPTLQRMLAQRIGRQADMMELWPRLKEAAAAAQYYPKDHKAYVEHFLARALGLPSQADVSMARLIEGTVGAVQRAFGGKGLYDAFDVMSLAMTSNDLTYMGFLGLKPFSAMRNLFQPLILVPTDLGGIKDIKTLSEAYWAISPFKKGAAAARRDALLAEIRGMGVIPRDITAEFGTTGKNILRDRRLGSKVLPQNVPGLSQIKDFSMLMFSGSHKINCYVTAAAAMLKWDRAFGSFIKGVPPYKVGGKTLNRFMKKAGVWGRDATKKAEIEVLLRKRSYKEARETFVRSVVTDTQFVYTAAETPLATNLAGGIGKTGAIFQTWWMNYGTTIHKWATTGVPPSVKAQKAISLVFSGGAAYSIMRAMWEHEVAKKTVLAGPFPTPGELFRPPPVWKGVFETIRLVTTAGGLSVSEKPYTERVAKQAARWAKTAFPLVTPGGLQILQTGKRIGFPPFEPTDEPNAFIKSMIRYKKAQEG